MEKLAYISDVSRGATIKIAASDASEKSKKGADFVCAGTDDSVIINQAIAALNVQGNGAYASSIFVNAEFENAYNPFLPDGITKDQKTIVAPSYNIVDDIKFTQSTSTTGTGYYTVGNPETGNQTKFIKGVSKSQLTIETAFTKDSVPYGISPTNGKLGIMMRIRRLILSDDLVTIKFLDLAGNEIFNIDFSPSSIPILNASSSYGTQTTNPSSTIIDFPYSTDWIYIKAELDFNNHTFKLYYGKSRYKMRQFVKTSNSFGFKNASAANLNKISIGAKGALNFDSLNIYQIEPEAPITGGGRIALSEGTFRLFTGTINVPSKVWIQGQGSATKIVSNSLGFTIDDGAIESKLSDCCVAVPQRAIFGGGSIIVENCDLKTSSGGTVIWSGNGFNSQIFISNCNIHDSSLMQIGGISNTFLKMINSKIYSDSYPSVNGGFSIGYGAEGFLLGNQVQNLRFEGAILSPSATVITDLNQIDTLTII